MVSVFLLKEILSVKSSRPYVFTTLIFGVVALFSPYKRFLFLLPIFGNVAVSYSIISTNKLSKLFLSVIAFVFLILSLSLRPSYYEVSQTSISFLPYLREGRSICFTDEIDICHFQSVYFPQQNREVIAGAFPQSQSKAKRSYLVNLFNPTKINQTEYLALLKAGFITNIIINKNLSKHVNYFRSFGSFEKIYEDERFIIFSPKDRFSYLELNGKNIISKVEKRKDEIYIHTLCNESGTLLIKESFHPGWRIYLNGRMVKAKENKFGFILINAKRGSCIIKMVFDKYWFFGI